RKLFSEPDSEPSELVFRCFCPAAVRLWACRARVEDGADDAVVVVKGGARPVHREGSDTDDESRPKDLHGVTERCVAGSEQRALFRGRQLVRRQILATRFDEGERAVVQDEIVLEEALRGAET